MSFKYRFIFSFVILEAFFIIVIVSLNQLTLKNSADKLINEKIESNSAFLEELIKVPMSIFDLANLDDLVENSTRYMNSIVILDNEDRILSSSYSYNYTSLEDFIKVKKSRDVSIKKNSYKIVYKRIHLGETFLGSMFIVYDNTLTNEFIQESKNNVYWIILAEIILSSLLAFLIGNSLTRKLTTLSEIAKKIGREEKTFIPFINSNDEIGKLSKSMNRMQTNLHIRNKTIKKSNKQLEKQKDDLLKANKVKDDFMANMSHELKTPLNSINVLSSIMKNNSNKNLTQKDVKNLEIINSCGKDLLSLINDVLDISKLEAGKVSINNSKINFYELISSLYDMFIAQFKNKDIDLVFEYDENIKTIFSDDRKISQIIKNLLSNALKFTTEGKVSLIVKQEEQYVVVIVEDNGIGIKKEELKNLFNRFKQVDESISRKHLGSGLGLSISKNLAHLLKGSIHVESEFGHGSKFSLKIPIDFTEEDFVEVKEDIVSIESIQKSENKIAKRKEILIYNNNPLVFLGLIIKLKKENEIIQTNNESNFFNELVNTKNNIDTIVVDIDKLSQTFIDKLLAYNNKNIVIITSNDINNDIKSKVKELIYKPINLDKINGII